MTPDHHIPRKEWEIVVANVPIVSVDLVVQDGDSIILGKRANEPAKGEWWVPGGRIHKHEQLEDAVHRVAKAELGISVKIQQKLGVYEHFYDIADVADVGGKHYVPIGFLVTPTDDELSPDDQHTEFNWFTPPFDNMNINPYVQSYLEDAGILGE